MTDPSVSPQDPSANLLGDLYSSARQLARRGMEARSAGDHGLAAMDFGVMVEHLSKLYLATIDPVLIADERASFPSLVVLSGHRTLLPTAKLRTVGLGGALDRIAQLDRSFVALRVELDPLIELRNGRAHVGSAGPDADQAAILALRAAEFLLAGRGGTEALEFYGEYDDAVRSLLDAEASEVRRRVELKRGRAREVWRLEYATLSARERERRLAFIDVRATVDLEGDTQAQECPVCEQTGVIRGDLDVDAEVDGEIVDGEAVAEITGLSLVMWTRSFRCPVCRLNLDGPEELGEAGLPHMLYLGEVGPDDMAEYLSDSLDWVRENVVFDGD